MPEHHKETEELAGSKLINRATPASDELDLRAFTPARISLGRTGTSVTTRESLSFALDHSKARDAVHATLSLPTLLQELQARGLEVILVKSAVSDRATYLRRPDLGRMPSEDSINKLGALPRSGKSDLRPRLTIILADGAFGVGNGPPRHSSAGRSAARWCAKAGT